MYTGQPSGYPRPMMMPTLGPVSAGPTIGTTMARPMTTTVGATPTMGGSVVMAAPTTVGGSVVMGSGGVQMPTRTVVSTGATAGTTYVTSGAAPQTVTRTVQAPTTTLGGSVVMGSTIGAPRTIQSGTVISGGTIQAPTIGMPTTTTMGATRVISTTQGQPYYLGQYSQQAYEAKTESKQEEDAQLKNLKALRKNSGLKYVPVSEGLKGLKDAAVEDKLTKDQFQAAYRKLIEKFGVDMPDQKVQDAVFDLFDRDDNGVVDMMELICGISLLCQGTEDDKIKAVFDVFDENGDGFISMDEMFKFLTAVFKVVLTPNVMGVMRGMGVEVDSAEDLASVTSLECFKAADLNHDGKLSLSEFQNWFYAPKNDPSFMFSPMRKLLQ